MYLKNIFIENVGGIEEFNIQEASFLNDDGNPRPIILVGTNGSGKTTVLSSIADALFELSNKVFQDILPQNGLGYSYYKISGAINQSVGKNYGFTYLQFKDNKETYEYIDKTGKITFEAFKTKTKNSSNFFQSEWKEDGNCKICTDVRKTKSFGEDFRENSYCFFPSDRFEYPHWLNRGNEINNLQLSDNIKHTGKLEKPILAKTSLNQVKSWILDVIVDSIHYDSKHNEIGFQFNNDVSFLFNQSVQNIEAILSKIMCVNIEFKLNYRTRGLGRLTIINKETGADIIPSLDNLSAGQSTLLSMFALIVKYSDLQDLNKSIQLSDIKGIVLIDEIDLHLHIKLQKEILPELIKLFPKVQFIVSSHSPFFLFGMDQTFKENVLAINMPEGVPIRTDDFEEFEKAYGIFNDLTSSYKKELDKLKKKIEENGKPLIICEGKTDVMHMRTAMRRLKKDLDIEFFEVPDVFGESQLEKVYDSLGVSEEILGKINKVVICMFDRDSMKTNSIEGDNGKPYDKKAGNRYSFYIPIPEHRKAEHKSCKKSFVSIEHYYKDEDLKKEYGGKCLHFMHEINEHKEIGSKNKKIYSGKGEGVLTKTEFANLVADDKNDFSNDFDFKEFKKIFDIIEKIIQDSRSG